MRSSTTNHSTLPGFFLDAVRRYGHRVCSYHFESTTGRWEPSTWSDWSEEVRRVAAALGELGIGSGDRVGILSATRREWLVSDLAVMSISAVTVGIYDTHTAEQCGYILGHSGVRVLFVEDRDQLHKVREVWDELPDLKHVVLFEHAADLEGPRILSYAGFDALGAQVVAEERDLFGRRVELIDPSDLAIISYTSGTTGPPKGVMLTHRCVAATIRAVRRAVPMQDSDVTIVNLSLAHSLQRVGGWAALACGASIVFGDRLDRFPQHLKQFKPTVQLSVPRVFEKMYGRIMSEVAEQDGARRKMFEWALDVARQVRAAEREGRRVPRHMRLQMAAAERTVLAPLRDQCGGRIRYFVSGAAPLSAEIIEFFGACGMPIYEGYGLTETCAPATVNTERYHRTGSVGRALDVCEIHVADDGEILIRGENVTIGYYRDTEATEAAFAEGGWFRTGDLGALDGDGFLTITGRKKDLIITAGGKNIAPANIEGAFEQEALIRRCVVHGDRQKFLVALFDLDAEALEPLIERFGLHNLDAARQRTHPRVIAEVQLIVDRVNRTLARFETVKYFKVLEQPLSIENELLTPTLKVRRQEVYRRFELELAELYQTRRERRESLW